jgi:APA family basic amino acid/polyamine antiporter
MHGLFRRKSVDVLQDEALHTGLKRVLTATDLVFLGIGAIIGAGIFATVGTASAGDPGVRPPAGPAIVLSFVFTGLACTLAALCYAEMASMVPVSGSAYTYAYATLGELVAWIIGWDLIIEYAVGNVAVAISWSGYFQEFLRGFGFEFPAWMAIDFRTARMAAETAVSRLPDVLGAPVSVGQVCDYRHLISPEMMDAPTRLALAGFCSHPVLLGVPVVFNLPAVMIVTVLTVILVIGIKESAWFNNVMVLIKLAVLGLFVVTGLFYVRPENYTPFAPGGWKGIMAGAAIIFFAYIGFDAVSTAAEEARNPGRDLPIGIIGSLIACTLIYVAVAAVVTGMVPYTQLNTPEPLTVALKAVGESRLLHFITGLVALGSVIAHTAVLLVFQLGQPRIFFSMARDGLLPSWAAAVHPRFRTPYVTTILTGVIVAGTSAFTNIQEMVELTNIGTLFAFMIVSAGVLVLRYKEPDRPRPFRTPLTPWVPLLSILTCGYLAWHLPAITWVRFFLWLAVGLVFYFLYGFRHSRLRTPVPVPADPPGG